MSEAGAAPRAVVVGAGFTGLAAAYELGLAGWRVTVLEADDDVGGLAGDFEVGGTRLDRFYHHWFRSDRDVLGLIDELGASERLVERESRTALYHNRGILRLSTPLDVLRFGALPLRDRLRLGRLVLAARRVRDFRQLDGLTAGEWLREVCGERAFHVVWEPLLRGKFGPYADDVSAVWIWNKLKLRGGSRGRDGAERLAYFRGGFAALARLLAERIVDIVRLRNLPAAEQRAAAKWRRALATLDWIATQIPPGARFQIYAFNERAEPVVRDSAGRWLDAGDPAALNGAVDATKQIAPQGGTSLYHAFKVIGEMKPRPDNVFLVTDGLPTIDRERGERYTVSGEQRLRMFNAALESLQRGIPVNVILLPMEGDPMAASAFWRLAQASRGSLISPAEDWP